MELRRATPADADELAATVSEGFEGYRAFAPPQWTAPDRLELALGLAMRLGNPAMRAWIAERDGEHQGHVTWLPATESRKPSDEEGLAHLEQLFARRAHWGPGTAKTLMDRAVEEAREAGFTKMRLATPTGHPRARRFYEREGWTAGAVLPDEPIGLELVEYRLDLR